MQLARLRLLNAAAQTRIVSAARIGRIPGKSVRPFKEIICSDISEFESYMPSQAVRSPASLPAGFLGGGQVGCNLQFGSNWVIGIEGDGSGSDIRGDITQTVLGITGTAHAQTDWIASATGRLGWAWDRWLLYAKGGAAWAGDKYSAFIPVFNEQLEASETRTGWTVGGGIEWAFWSNWSAKAEYDYYDFGTRTLTLTGTFAGAPIQVSGVNVRQRISVGKFGINYRF
jgi:outer membrane immunogenic protein